MRHQIFLLQAGAQKTLQRSLTLHDHPGAELPKKWHEADGEQRVAKTLLRHKQDRAANQGGRRAVPGRLAKALNGPLNILATAGVPNIKDLERLGVRRVSVGSGPMRAAMGLTQRIAKELKEHGTFASMTEGAMPYKEANELFMK